MQLHGMLKIINLWRAVYTPGDRQTSRVYSTTLVQSTNAQNSAEFRVMKCNKILQKSVISAVRKLWNSPNSKGTQISFKNVARPVNLFQELPHEIELEFKQKFFFVFVKRENETKHCKNSEVFIIYSRNVSIDVKFSQKYTSF
jgi:hypothetical protein